jgi:hydrogenase expression/formation protein HypE
MSGFTSTNNGMTPLSCPVPVFGDAERITLGHGEGGRLTRRLIRERILPQLGNPYLLNLADAAALPQPRGPLAFTTDSYVVTPLFFPGGDIGTLAVNGTINDLAVSGARPLWLSLGLIVEEGLPFATLDRVLQSVADAARAAGVQVVTGDTKVVPRGAADGLFLTVSGLGERLDPVPGPLALEPGDEILVSGPIGRHGVAVLAAREGLAFHPPPESDTASLIEPVSALRAAGVPARAMRDATRGGVAAVLHEWAEASGRTLAVEEEQLPVTPGVRGVCELLGLDPIYVACEGVMVVAVPAEQAHRALEALRTVPLAAQANRIGAVRTKMIAPVLIARGLGREQPLDEPLAAALPRIC